MKKLVKKDDDRKESRLDKFVGYYLHGRKLTKSQEEMRIKYEKVNSLLCTGYSRDNVVSVLTKEPYNLRTSQAYQIVQDTIRLFGDVTESNVRGLKHIFYENFMLDANMARKAGDFGTAVRARENAGQIYQIFDKAVNNDILVEMFTINIERSTDPQTLVEAKIIDITPKEEDDE